MVMTPLTIPKRNQVDLTFTGPWLPPPDGCAGFSTFEGGLGGTLGNGQPRILSSAHNEIEKLGGVWKASYYVDIVAPVNDFYGAYHAEGTTSGHGTTASLLGVGSHVYVTDAALNMKLLGFNVSGSIGMLSVDLDGSTVFDGGDAISITINDDNYIGTHSGVMPVAAWQKFTTGMGVCWLTPASGGVPASDGYYAVTDQTDAKYNAFQNDADYFLSRRWIQTFTSGAWNYTITSQRPKSDVGPYIQLYKWQPEAIGGGTFTQENYAIALSDATDDSLFQDFVVFNATKIGGLGTDAYAVSVMTNNQNTQIAGGILADATVVSQTMFCFASDFSWYDRIDLTSDGTLEAGFVFMDLLGNYYLGGSNGGGSFYSLALDTPLTGGGVLHTWTFTLDGHDIVALRLNGDATLMFDLSSEEWVEWSDSDKETWRAQCGMNWAGGAALSNTYGTNILVGDDTLGLLWFLDPTQPYDQSPDPEAPQQAIYFPRIIQGQVVVAGREVKPCYACWLTTDMGAPAYTGAGVKLEISDDGGNSYDDMGTVTVTAGVNSPELAWYSLGQIGAPGRLFKITDDGAVARIDGMEMNDPDDK